MLLAVLGAPVTTTVGGGGRTTVSGMVTLPVVPTLSDSVTTRLAVPAARGVPESVPSEARFIPAGTPVALKLSGGTPPVAWSTKRYAAPTVAFGSVFVEITSGGGVIVTLNDLVAVVPLASVTVALTLNPPRAVGVPLIAPLADAERPSGSPLAENEYGVTPPVALRLAE